MRKGYKQTEVGVIPEDWDVVDLAKISHMKSGESITSANIDQTSKYPCYGGNGLRGYTNRYTHDGQYALIGRQGALCGNVVGASGKFFASEHAVVVTPTAQTDIQWLTYVLGNMGLNQYSESSAQPGLSVAKILMLRIAFPNNKVEQKAIAAALSDVDSLLTSLDALIAKKRLIKQGAMQELLNGKKRLPGFSGEWEEKKLGDIGFTYGGMSGKTKSDFEDGVYPYIPFLNILNNPVIDINYFDYVNISPTERQNKAQKNDLFFNGSSETPEEVGMCSVLLEDIPDLYLNSFCFGFRQHENSNANSLFITYFFRSNVGRKLIYFLAQGATRYNLSKTNFLKLLIPYPSLSEQTAIAETLSDMDAEISALESRREKTRLLKQGMMQELLTGRIRLV